MFLRLGVSDLIGVFAYTQAFALFESSILFTVLLVLAFALPWRLLREDFIVRGTALIFLTSPWAFGVYLLIVGNEFRNLGLIGQLALLIAYLAWLGAAYLLILRHELVRRAVRGLVERIAVLSVFYLAVDVISVGVVLVRNV